MIRHECDFRKRWLEIVKSQGFTYHTFGNRPSSPEQGTYWNEGVCYEFLLAEVDELEAATQELHSLCMQAVGYLYEHPAELKPFCIPEGMLGYVFDSWHRKSPHVSGRFDFAYDGVSPPKMLEYNADTPTALIETAIIQWRWLEDPHPGADQFNSVHEKLIARWRELASDRVVYFASLDDGDGEERQTALYMADTAMQGGVDARWLSIAQLGWDQKHRHFVDEKCAPIANCFKLYPWEWMFREEFGKCLPYSSTRFFEPPWKSLLSNKAILPVLWKLFPGHPNLLSTFYEPRGTDYVKKPILGREGHNTEIRKEGIISCSVGGVYGSEGYIYQQPAPVPQFDGQHLIIGSWVIGDDPAGIILREDPSPIVRNTSPVVPHFIGTRTE